MEMATAFTVATLSFTNSLLFPKIKNFFLSLRNKFRSEREEDNIKRDVRQKTDAPYYSCLRRGRGLFILEDS